MRSGSSHDRTSRSSRRRRPAEVAPGVFLFTIRGSHIYFVRSGQSWVLIDAAWSNRGLLIKQTVEQLFGENTRPAAILLTHVHADHSGSALELARSWDLPLHVHPDEMPLTDGTYRPEYADPIARWMIEPLMRLMPRRAARMVAKTSLGDAALALDAQTDLPGLPDWEAIPTPGHTPGHVAFFRPSDRVLIAGDAVLTLNFNSLWDLLRNKQRVSGPPRISTWNWPAAKESVAALAALEPNVLACGHGKPMTGPGTAQTLRGFADRFAIPDQDQPQQP